MNCPHPPDEAISEKRKRVYCMNVEMNGFDSSPCIFVPLSCGHLRQDESNFRESPLENNTPNDAGFSD